ncbi:MAG: CDGSH iron-sulfur domain-containing protein [Dehalococcoidia bacterium]
MADLNIEIRDNGPYLIRGGVTVKDADGNTFETQDVVALCRCGHSGKKPFCDGTHRGEGFESAPRANQ